MNRGPRKVCAWYQPESPGKGTPDRFLDRDRGIATADLVDESREPVGERWILELEHVLGVQLARVGEVEAADEDAVVRDRDLRVHVVVHRAGGVRRGDLAGEGRSGERRPQQRRLPFCVPVL